MFNQDSCIMPLRGKITYARDTLWLLIYWFQRKILPCHVLCLTDVIILPIRDSLQGYLTSETLCGHTSLVCSPTFISWETEILQRKCREHLSNLPSHHDNVTHQGISISQPCYEEKCMERKGAFEIHMIAQGVCENLKSDMSLCIALSNEPDHVILLTYKIRRLLWSSSWAGKWIAPNWSCWCIGTPQEMLSI